jgi:thioredoxin 2
VCGKCKKPIHTDILNIEHPVAVTDMDFQAQVIQFPLPVLLDCWAPWCGPCQMMGPVLEDLAKKWKGRARVAKMNMDENPVTSTRFSVQSIPTFLIFKDGQLQDTLIGAVPKNSIIQTMSKYI